VTKKAKHAPGAQVPTKPIKKITEERLKEIRRLDEEIALAQVTLQEKKATYQRKVTEALTAIHVRSATNAICLDCGSVLAIRAVQTQEGIQKLVEACKICLPTQDE